MKVACDLFLDQTMFKLPKTITDSLSDHFPNIEIVRTNCPSHNPDARNAQIYWGNRITQDVFDYCPNLEWIHFGSVGIDRMKRVDLRGRDVIVTSSRGLVKFPMAISIVGHICSFARGINFANALRGRGALTREAFDHYFDSLLDLQDARALLVGYGAVGKTVAPMLKSLGLRVSAVVRNESQGDEFVDYSYSLNQLREVISRYNFVINLLPLNNETFHIFDSATLRQIDPKGYFINVGRGQTVDESCLVEMLLNGDLAGAALDVFDAEPLSNDHPLMNCDTAILTPHVSGWSTNYWPKQEELFIYNLKCWRQKKYSLMKNREKL